jgi:aspartokinase-like uncharacterized kinase
MRSMQGYKGVFVSSGNLFQDLWQRKSKKEKQLKDKLIISLKRLSNEDLMPTSWAITSSKVIQKG